MSRSSYAGKADSIMREILVVLEKERTNPSMNMESLKFSVEVLLKSAQVYATLATAYPAFEGPDNYRTGPG